jgi:hypothetical protein
MTRALPPMPTRRLATPLLSLVGVLFSCSTLAVDIPEEAIILDVIGHHALQREEVLEGFPSPVMNAGNTLYFMPDDKTIERDGWCNDIVSRGEIVSAHCMRFTFGTKNDVQVVGIVERGRAHLAVPKAPQLKDPAFSLAPSLIALKKEHLKTLGAELDSGKRVNKVVEDGVVYSDNTSLRALEARMHEQLASQAEYLLTVLESAAPPYDRATAVSLLNHVGEPQRWIPRVIPFVNDHDPLVRNNTTLALINQAIAGSLSGAMAIELANSVEHLLHSSIPTDLNKGIALLYRLVSSGAIAFGDLAEHTQAQIRYLAATSRSENIGAPARALLGQAP